ncbi:chemotaxis protein CheW [Clostridium beijerinckii]|uniref:chemotaxis protein CheW n=1 Tax=Clostridium beijerinckii TaxID=1520 RepID=UPI0022DFA7D1|nr:chemotaxis protein CheW [Clostridium beijerinckii]
MPRGKGSKEAINSIDKIKREINKKKQNAIDIHNSNEVIAESDNSNNSNLAFANNETSIKDANKANNDSKIGNKNIKKQTKSTSKANKVASKGTKGTSTVNKVITKGTKSASKISEITDKEIKSTGKRKEDIDKDNGDGSREDKDIIKENHDINTSSENINKDYIDGTMCKTKYVVFIINNEEYAIDLVNVKEIVRVPEIKRVPNSTDIEGVCSLRGELVTIIDIHKRYNISQSEYNDNSRVIVMEFKGFIIGIIVDKVSQVLEIDNSSIKLVLENNDDAKVGCIDGIIMEEHGKRLIMIMDVQSIVNINGLRSILTNADKQEREKISAFVSENEENEQLIIFSLNGAEYAFHVSEVKEIIRIPKIAKTPNVSNFIEGIISLRDEIIGVVNLSKIINMNSQNINNDGSILLINIGDFTYGAIVDKVSEVKLVSKKDLLKPSQVIGNIDVKIVKEFANIDNGKRVVTVLDPYKIINLEELQNDFKSNKNDVMSSNLDKSMLDSKKITESIVIFKIENEEYGISINFVEEINTISKITCFPSEEKFIDGLVNLRGDMIPIINLKTFFGLDFQDNDSYCKILIVKINNTKVGIRIDSASEVISISKDMFQNCPKDLNPEDNRRYIDGIIKLDDGRRIVLSLNPDEVFNFM